MPLFVYVGRDSARGLELRPTQRPAHLDHISALGDRVRFAGPLLDDTGKPCGSLVLFEADDLDSARKIAHEDPYLTGGVFQSVEVFATTQVAPTPTKS